MTRAEPISSEPAICDRCCDLVEFDEIQQCAGCERDGLCLCCLDNHGCESIT